MTNRQYFISQLGYAASADVVEAALTDAGLIVTDTYIIGNSIPLKKAAINSLLLLLSTPDIKQGTGETTFSATYDRDAIMVRIGILQDELGTAKPGPTIKSRSVW